MEKEKEENCKGSDCFEMLLNALSYATIPTLLSFGLLM